MAKKKSRKSASLKEQAVLRLLKGEEKKHDGTIIPDSINQLWGTDGTLFGTINGDLLWLFAVIDHFSDEILGWHIVEVGYGDRFAALEPIKQGLRRIRGCVGRWMETYNTQWLIERNGYRTPREVRQACQESQSAVA